MSIRMLEAIYRKDGRNKKIALSDMTEDDYRKRFRGHLFCPNSNCNARVIFVSGEVRPHFRTWRAKVVDGEISDEHIEKCPYFVEHELEERALRRYNPDLIHKVSPEHISRVLKNAYDRQFNPDKFKPDKLDEGSKKRPSSRSRTNTSLAPRGRAGLGIEGAEIAEKEPSIFRKSIGDVTELDYSSVQCITGFVDDMSFDKEYPYLTFEASGGKPGRILFSEAFAVNNRAQFNLLYIYKDYIDAIKNLGATPFVCVFGKIINDYYGITIIIDAWNSILVDKKSLYAIHNELQQGQLLLSN